MRYVHRVLHKALADAHRKGIVTRNVAALADPPKPSTDGEPNAIQVWDASELRRFLDATAAHRHHVLWTLAAKTGMRRGEFMGLRWHDIDFGRSTITIRRRRSQLSVGSCSSPTSRRVPGDAPSTSIVGP